MCDGAAARRAKRVRAAGGRRGAVVQPAEGPVLLPRQGQIAPVIAALFLAAQLVIMRHKRKEELARATGGYHFPVEINFPPEEP